MKMSMGHKIAVVALGALTVAAAHGQLVFTSAPQTITVDFQSPISNVLGYNTTVSYGSIRETYVAVRTDQMNFRTLGWSVRASGINIGGNGAGNWTPFAAEIEVPPDSSEDHFVVNDMHPARSPADGSGTGTWRQTARLNSGDYGYGFGGGNHAAPWRDFGATLRALNNTGGPVTQWNYSLEAWYADNDTNVSNMVLSYSTDNVTYTTLQTLNGGQTFTGTFDVTDPNHFSPILTPSGTINVTVPQGGYFYFRIEMLRPGGSGSGSNWYIDVIQLEAVPEPATLSVLLGAGGLLMLRRRLRKA